MDIFSEGLNLIRRYEKGDAFRNHIHARMNLVVPVIVVCAVISLTLCIGILGLMEKGGLRGLLAIASLPIVLFGSALLQFYVFFSWLELRALRPILAHEATPVPGPQWLRRLRSRLGKAPAMPWIPLAVLIGVPFALLAATSFELAALVLVLAVAMPLVYAHLDR